MSFTYVNVVFNPGSAAAYVLLFMTSVREMSPADARDAATNSHQICNSDETRTDTTEHARNAFSPEVDDNESGDDDKQTGESDHINIIKLHKQLQRPLSNMGRTMKKTITTQNNNTRKQRQQKQTTTRILYKTMRHATLGRKRQKKVKVRSRACTHGTRVSAAAYHQEHQHGHGEDGKQHHEGDVGNGAGTELDDANGSCNGATQGQHDADDQHSDARKNEGGDAELVLIHISDS
jgi:hypothetical protein